MTYHITLYLMGCWLVAQLSTGLSKCCAELIDNR